MAASAFIMSSSVPDSAALTVADRLHMEALGLIFLTLLVSAFCLRLEVRGREKLAFRIDHWSLAVLPPVLWLGRLRDLHGGALTRLRVRLLSIDRSSADTRRAARAHTTRNTIPPMRRKRRASASDA